MELVVADMAASLAFYRHLGLGIPTEADTEPHVDVDLGGIHLAFDTREVILGLHPGWTPASGGHRVALAFAAGSPEDVDAAYTALVGAGAEGVTAPWTPSGGCGTRWCTIPTATPSTCSRISPGRPEAGQATGGRPF